MTTAPFAMQRLSTEDIPQGERMAFLHDFMALHVWGGRRLLPPDRDAIRVDLEAMALPSDLLVSRGRFTPMRGIRARDLLQDGRQNYVWTIQDDEREISVAGKAPVRIAAGDLVLVSEGICHECWHGRPSSFDFVSLDRRLLADRAPRIELEASYVIPAAAEGMSLLRNYVELLRRNPPSSLKLAEAAARHVYDLTALVLGGTVRGGTERNETSIAAARYKLVRKDVLERLCDRDLHIEAVARRQGVTVRYVQRLFENAGTTFSDFLRGQRLEHAVRLLKERDLAASTITAIAYDVGFSDVSSFNRAFRKRFDATPSEVRAEILSRRAALPKSRD
jgi:AraC-like DNA-binding protein